MTESQEKMSNPLWIKCTTLPGNNPPSYQTPGSAGCDLYSTDEVTIHPGQRAVIGTGLHLEIPQGFEGQVRSRSGLSAKHGVFVLNSPGTIDSDYRGEVRVILYNSGDHPFFVKKGDRIAQLVFSQIYQAIFQKSELISGTSRGSGGFGSTGV